MKTKILAALAGATVASAALAQTTYIGAPVGGNPGVLIPDNNAVGLSFTINSTFGGAITDMVLTLRFGDGAQGATGNQGHSWLGDLILTLSYTPNTGPAIAAQTILERVGRTGGQGGPSGFGRDDDMMGVYSFANIGSSLVANPVGNIQTIADGPAGVVPSHVLNTNGIQVDAYAGHNGINQIANAFAAFIGADGTGVWTITISDRAGGDVGDIIAGAVTLVPSPSAAALLGLGGLAATRRRRA